jgi:uncharacterized membrane protein YuzA (DUF378 family)
MGWFQDTIWNNIFDYAYPISSIGAIFYGILAVFQTDVSNIFTNKNWLFVFNVFIGLCGLLAAGSWFNTDLSFADPVTGIIDLKLNQMRNSVKRGVLR